ncbi:unnamed protein product [Owenia fusiformis]|uniref:Carbohydrate sulfotransferase n=1 Tax=Owenia fusiformis TaxID=6347 RepID=A0A8S4PM73_OWEFU|nr:unnamed protein product [Owenia fusiformis]
MCKRKLKRPLAVCLCTGTILLVIVKIFELNPLYNIKDRNIPTEMPKFNLAELSTKKVLKERRDHLEKVCAKHPNISKQNMHGGSIMVGKHFPFVYCDIPKVGSSTFKRILYSLENNISNPYKMMAIRLGGNVRDYAVKKDDIDVKILNKIENYTRILIVRDPISRLISAYWDKMYSINPTFWCKQSIVGTIFNLYRSNKKVSTDNTSTFTGIGDMSTNKDTSIPECICDISFKEFLGFIIQEDTEDKVLNRHWRPQYKYCNPCKDIKYDVIAHLETFNEDTDFFLKKIGATSLQHDEHESDVVTREVDILLRGYIKLKKKTVCQYSMQDLIVRVFQGLVARGYISRGTMLPALNPDPRFYTRERLYALFLKLYQTSNGYRISKAELRRNMLKQVPSDMIKKIYDMYKYDFELFGYEYETQ